MPRIVLYYNVLYKLKLHKTKNICIIRLVIVCLSQVLIVEAP